MEDIHLGASPTVQRLLFGEEATTTINEDNSGSRSINSPPRKRRKMGSSSHTFVPSGVGVDAKWPFENEKAFVMLMYDEVVKGNVAGRKFTHSQWLSFLITMKEQFPTYTYTTTQLRGKCDRLKQRGKKIPQDLNNGHRFWLGRDKRVDRWFRRILGFLDIANPADEVLCRKGLLFYHELTTIFSPTTATGSMSRVSTQQRPHPDEFDYDPAGNTTQQQNEGTPSYASRIPRVSTPRSGSRRRKPQEPSVVSVMQSYIQATNTITHAMTECTSSLVDAL